MSSLKSPIRSALSSAVLSALMASDGSAVVPTGGIKSLTIMDTTPIDPVSSVGANGSGWVAVVVLKGLTSLVGTAVPSALTISVTDPGYDTSGNITSVARTITGVAHIARQYPNNASRLISTDGTDLTLYISLDDWVYSGTTIVSASIGGTFYPACVASASPSNINLSATAYTKPLFGWVNPQQDSATGSSYAVEAVAFHRHARNGQMVACMKYYVTDGTNTSADVLVSATTTSARITNGNVPEVWAGSVDMSAQTQGSLSNVVAKVYPWIGDSTAVLDLSTDGVAWPTSLPRTKLRVLCDRTGAYGGGYAYVKVGASGGAVSAVAATAQASPFPTLTAAAAALKTWNNANKSHNDLGGGFIRFMDDGSGGPQTHTIATGTANSPGLTWCNIEKDPSTAAVVSVTWSVQSSTSDMARWRNLTLITGSINYSLLGNAVSRSMQCLDNIAFDNTNNKNLCTWFDLVYAYNLSVTGGAANCDFLGIPSAAAAVAAMMGVTNSTGTSDNWPALMVGNVLPAMAIGPTSKTDGNHGRIIYNNRLKSAVMIAVAANTVNYGVANVQNLYEQYAASVCMNFYADSDLTTITNYVEMHNTSVGERASRIYNDVVATKTVPNGLQKIGTSRFNVWDNYNVKSDTFNSGVGSVGNWAYTYNVGNAGNVSLFGAVQRLASEAPSPGGVSYLANAWLPSSESNLFRTALGFTQAQIMDMFTGYTVAPRGAPAAGGNYKPLSTATHLKNRVPAGFSVLQKDISGAARRTDGTGAAGAYEY